MLFFHFLIFPNWKTSGADCLLLLMWLVKSLQIFFLPLHFPVSASEYFLKPSINSECRVFLAPIIIFIMILLLYGVVRNNNSKCTEVIYGV